MYHISKNRTTKLIVIRNYLNKTDRLRMIFGIRLGEKFDTGREPPARFPWKQ